MNGLFMVLMYEWELYTDLNTCIGNLCCCSSTLMWILFYKWNVFSIGNLNNLKAALGEVQPNWKWLVDIQQRSRSRMAQQWIGQVQYIVLNYLKVTWKSLTPTPRQIFKNITVYTGWTLRPLVQFILLYVCIQCISPYIFAIEICDVQCQQYTSNTRQT